MFVSNPAMNQAVLMCVFEGLNDAVPSFFEGVPRPSKPISGQMIDDLAGSRNYPPF